MNTRTNGKLSLDHADCTSDYLLKSTGGGIPYEAQMLNDAVATTADTIDSNTLVIWFSL